MIGQILQQSLIPTFVINDNHIITHWNKACEKLTGELASDMIGTEKQWRAFYSEQKPVMADLIVVKASKEEVIRHFGPKVQESTLVDGAYEAEGFFPDLRGQDRWLFTTASPLTDNHGKIIGAIETLQDITARKRAEKELRLSEIKFRTIADFTYDWEYWRSPDGCFMYISPSCERITGYGSNDFFDNPDLLGSLTHPDDRSKFLRHLKNEMNPDRVSHIDFRIITQKGEERWISHFCQPVFDANGKHLGQRASNRDITKRKLLEAKLRTEREKLELRVKERTTKLSSANASLLEEVNARKNAYDCLQASEEELRNRKKFIETILDNLPIGLAVSKLTDGTVHYMNSEFTQIYGWPKDALSSFDEFLDRVYPDPKYRKVVRKRVIRDIATRDLSKMIWKNLLPTTQGGEQRVVTVRGIPLFEQNLLISTAQDVTEKHKASEALQFTRFSIDHANDMIYWVNPDGKIIDVNKTTCIKLGCSRDELLSMTVMEINPSLTLDKFEEDWETLKHQGMLRAETSHYCKQGRAIPVEIHSNHIDFSGKEYNCVIARDIAERKELERLVSIQDKMGSLGRVTAGIAHEIRNPLSTINVYLSTLKTLLAGEDFDTTHLTSIKEAITEMDAASHKIETVVKRVMDFSKPNQQKMQLINVNQCIRGAVDLSAVTLRKSGIKLELNLDENISQCYLNKLLIEQVLLNLITNAREELIESEGEKYIEIKTTEGSHNGQRFISITVADSGSGVPTEMRDKIFDPFFTTKHYGSGIGLSICHRIISDHRGFLHVLPSRWGGAMFVAEFPIKKEATN